MNNRIIALYFLDALISVLGVGVALFWSAGRLDWWPAWAAIGVWLAWFTAMEQLMLRRHPDLLAERLAPPPGAKAWDKTILSSLRLVQLARYILAGLDQRYNWTGTFPLPVQIGGLLLCGLGYGVLLWALASNNFFSQVVRIQSERGHVVVRDGPYRFVRHPAYAGMIVFEFAMAALLGSGWALLASAGCALLIVLRTALEDRSLQAELTGYADYARQVRYRLVPGIW
jgi:protein-S-isoprenylcysteine O-methyltransferase Ste14